MLDLVQVLKTVTFSEQCINLKPIIFLLRDGIMPIIQIGIPILLILLGSIDLGKAVMSSDDKEIKGATSKLMKRAIMAVAVFFVPWIVNLVMSIVAGNTDGEAGEATNFAGCWSHVKAEHKTAGTYEID